MLGFYLLQTLNRNKKKECLLKTYELTIKSNDNRISVYCSNPLNKYSLVLERNSQSRFSNTGL